MLQPSAVADYLDILRRELSYDPALSRRVRLEVEDHLWEAAANEGGDAAEAQRRTIERFGDPRVGECRADRERGVFVVDGG